MVVHSAKRLLARNYMADIYQVLRKGRICLSEHGTALA